MEDELNLRPYLSVIWRRRYAIGVVTLSAILLAVILGFFIKRPVYEASALLVISGPRVPGLSLPTGPGPVLTADRRAPLVENKRAVGLASKHLPGPPVPAPEVFVKNVQISSLGADLLKVAARASSPSGAEALAEAWARALIEYVDYSSSLETRQALAVLQPKVDFAQKALDESLNSLTSFQARSVIPLLDEQVGVTAHRIALYESRLEELRHGRAPIGGDLLLEGSDRGYLYAVVGPREPAQVEKLLATLKSNFARYRAELAVAKRREEQLERRLDVARLTYQSFALQIEQLQSTLGGSTGTLRIAASSVASGTPIAPRKGLIIILAAILGAAAGTILAFIVEYLIIRGPASPPHETPNPSLARQRDLET